MDTKSTHSPKSLTLVDVLSLYALILFYRKQFNSTYFTLIKNKEIKSLIELLNDFYKNLSWSAQIDENTLSNLASLFIKLDLAHANFSLEKKTINRIRFYQLILKLYLHTFPLYHPTIAHLNHQIGLLYLKLNDRISIEYLNNALRIHERLIPSDPNIIKDLQLALKTAPFIFKPEYNKT